MAVASKIAKEMLRQFPFELSQGADCFYWQLSDDVGLKYPKHKTVAYNTFILQKYFHRFNLAPACWGFDGEAYFTENVETIVGHSYELIKKYSKLRKTLEATITAINGNIIPMDLHYGNVGILRGHLVVIDFSSFEWVNNAGKFRQAYVHHCSNLLPCLS